MKRQTSLWGSISVLIGVIIGIVALVRGPAFYPMILLAFAVWGVWAVLTLGLPQWRTGYVRRQMANETRSVRSELDAANVPVDVAQTLLRHVNYRISAYLKSAHPNARWEWVTRNPALLAVQGGIGRIRLYGVDDYDYADVELDQQGMAELFCLYRQCTKGRWAETDAADHTPAPGQRRAEHPD